MCALTFENLLKNECSKSSGLQPFCSAKCVLYLSAGLGSTLLLFSITESSVTPAGAQSSGQCETAGVYELQGQVV